MGTFSGTLNAAQAYIVNDIYLKYINPTASNRKIISMNYLSGIVVVTIGVILGFFAKDVNSILQWIVGALYGGYIAANMFKWYWWRFNANGFFWGMAAGIIAALVFPFIFPHTLPLYCLAASVFDFSCWLPGRNICCSAYRCRGIKKILYALFVPGGFGNLYISRWSKMIQISRRIRDLNWICSMWC